MQPAIKAKQIRYITPNVALGYPTIFEARIAKGDTKAKYSCAIVFLPDTDPKVRVELENLIDEVGREFHGPKYDQLKKANKLTLPIREDIEAGGYPEGSYFFNARSETKPGVVGPHAGPDGKPMPISDPSEIYPGVICKVSLNFFGYNTNGNAGVSAGLGNVQKVKEGKRFDFRRKAEDEFNPIEDSSFFESLI